MKKDIACDFSGYATKNDLVCSDGRVIRKDAFKDNDGTVVPLVWQHLHDQPENVLGHAILENREDGVYAYCSLNDTDTAQNTKTLIEHGDITSLSIYANKLKQHGSEVLHGIIREVSLVLAGANPGARIENLSFSHSDGSEDVLEDEALIFNDSMIKVFDLENEIEHTDSDKTEKNSENQNGSEKDEEDENITVQDVLDSLTEEQQNAVSYVIGKILEELENESTEETKDEEIEQSSEGGNYMKYNVFENDNAESKDETLSHSEIQAIFNEAPRNGSLKETFLKHGIENIEVLFPEARMVTPQPELITRQMEWVNQVWSGVKKSPFSRIKSVAANLTFDEARAKGYLKFDDDYTRTGLEDETTYRKKQQEKFPLLSRQTLPQTVYKLQKLHRDDILDIVDLDVVSWMKQEMRLMLDEELSRAILIGDGRDSSAEDKIREDNIRPIYGDSDVYTIYYDVDFSDAEDATEISNKLIDAANYARKDYMGSGNPVFFASPIVVTYLLLAKDKLGRRLYATLDELASALRVSKIIEVPVFEDASREDDGEEKDLLGIIVNLSDYTIGSDKGGDVNMFDDFDIDYNMYTYMIETRCSGALTKPYSAIVLEASSTDNTTNSGYDF